MWLSWSAAAVMAAALAVVGRAGRHWRAVPPLVAAVAWEAAVILSLYALWQWGGELAVTSSQGATGHGLWVWRAERFMPLPSELWVQHLVLPHPLWVQALNVFYAVVHVPALVIYLIWMFLRHRELYARWRNVGALLTGACLLIQMVPVAPPRLLPQLGFVDTAVLYHQSVYGPGGISVAPQLAAMPSVHVAWAILIAVVVVRVSSSRWRWLILAHPILTVIAVVATANHWWLDGVVAGLLLEGAVLAVAGARALADRLGPRRPEPERSAPLPPRETIVRH